MEITFDKIITVGTNEKKSLHRNFVAVYSDNFLQE
jgi:hypothetical protein